MLEAIKYTNEENKKKKNNNGAEVPGLKQQMEANARAKHAKELQLDEQKSKLQLARQDEDQERAVHLRREEENFTRVYAVKCYDGWLKVYDNSALILTKWLDGRLGRGYEMKSGKTDFGKKKARYGKVSIPSNKVGDFVARMVKAGLPLVADEPGYLEFELGERISQEDMIKMMHEDELIIENTNSQVMPHTKTPHLRAEVRTLMDHVYVQTRNQRDSTKDVFMNDVLRRTIKANKLVIAAARGNIELEECLTELGVLLEEMYGDATTMSDLGLVTAKEYANHVKALAQVEAERAREIKRMELARVNAKVKNTKKKAPAKTEAKAETEAEQK